MLAPACVGELAAGSLDGRDGLEDQTDHNQPFTTSAGEQTGNVVGYIQGTDLAAEVILVGAHHDHLGVVNGQIQNGVNDNASGISALLAIAQAVMELADSSVNLADAVQPGCS